AINEIRLTKRRHERILASTHRTLSWAFTWLFIFEAFVTLLDHQGKYNDVVAFLERASSFLFRKENSESWPETKSPNLQPGIQFYFGIAIILAATFLRHRCYQTLGRHFTFEVAILKDHQLVTSGPYGVIRHPGYAASLLSSFGIFTVLSSRGSWVRESGILETLLGQLAAVGYMALWAAVSVSLLLRLPKEERVLKKEFGKQWVDWKSRVPWKIVPGVY
ncbi:hypothetical protein VKT23_017380, partial [Stygiomarasmius scandens]